MRYKILSDSSSDITNAFYQGETAFDYAVVPMSINGPGGISLADIDPVDAYQFVEKPRDIKGKWSSSCPSPAAYLKELQGADCYFIVAISSRLSASYSTACMAAEMARAENPEAKIHVIDSKSATAAAVREFQSIFGLPPTGVTDFATWYKISHIYVAVSGIGELYGA